MGGHAIELFSKGNWPAYDSKRRHVFFFCQYRRYLAVAITSEEHSGTAEYARPELLGMTQYLIVRHA